MARRGNLSPTRLEGTLAERLSAFEELFPRVRLHSGRSARFLTNRLRAEAFVLGRHIFLSSLASGAVSRCTAGAVELLAHELTHVRQFRRHGIAVFLGKYLSEYLRARIAGAPHPAAYRAISLEREAQEAAESYANPPSLVSREAGNPMRLKMSAKRGSDLKPSKNA